MRYQKSNQEESAGCVGVFLYGDVVSWLISYMLGLRPYLNSSYIYCDASNF